MNPTNTSTDLPAFYYDLQSLAPLKQSASENPDDIETLRNVAEQFESMFMQMVLKSMREASASLGESIFDSDQSLFYRDMFDQQLSVKLSQNGGLGLADVLVEQLSRNSILSRPDPFAAGQVNPAYSGLPLNEQAKQIFPVQPTPTTLPINNIQRRAPVALAPTVTQHKSEVAQPDIGTNPAQPQSVAKEKGIWQSPAEFVRDIWPHAVDAAKQLGVDPKVLVAQSALETGWGSKLPKHPDGSSSFNLFGIKAGSDWQGDRVRVDTLEFEGDRFVSEKSAFRAYDSVGDALNDYVDFLKGRARYAGALENAADPEKYSRALQDAGYATDPIYADKILRVMQSAPIADGLASLSVDTSEEMS